MTAAVVDTTLGELLSPSQVNIYMMCPAKWYFRYLIGLSEPTTGALALGKAFHGTLARNFRQKLNTGHDMETRELSEVFSAEWSLASADAALRTSCPKDRASWYTVIRPLRTGVRSDGNGTGS